MATDAMSSKQQEKIWREESDVRTLAEAEKIKSDRGRMGAAQKRAKIIAAEKQQEAQAVTAVATGKIGGAVKPRSKSRAKRSMRVRSTRGRKKK